MVFHVLAAMAEFERSIIRERTIAGMAAARARGRRPGRKRTLRDEQCLQAYDDIGGGMSWKDAVSRVNIHPRTLKRSIARGCGKLPGGG